MTRICQQDGCKTVIYFGPGTTVTRHCLAHRANAYVDESDDERMERVCREMGWRRAKERR